VSDGKGGKDNESKNIVVTDPNTTLPAPTGVDASDGDYTDKVRISWDSVSGATHYHVYRANSYGGSKEPLGSWQSNRYYYDYEVTQNKHYFYFIKAASSNSGADESPFSASDEGWAFAPPPTSDEDKIEDVTHKLFQAINDRDWDEAKNCCVYGSDFYVGIDELEHCYNLYGALECDIFDEYIVNDINQIIINGEYAKAYVYITATAIVDGEVVELHGEGWYFLQKITNDWKIYDSGTEENGTYTIIASAGPNGSISPSGSITVSQGSDKSFTITPDTGYQIDDVLVDESSVGKVSSYTFNNVTQDYTIYATFKIEDSGTYDLCDIGPAGGYIFYDKGYYSSGWRYLEAAPVSTECEKQWGSYGTRIYQTETGIGTGQSNTTNIVAWLNNHSETGKAAQLCDALTEGGYSDWFLPSLKELNLMYTNLKVYGVGGFHDGTYWSSSDDYKYSAWGQDFHYGGNYYPTKDSTHRVRAIRAF